MLFVSSSDEVPRAHFAQCFAQAHLPVMFRTQPAVAYTPAWSHPEGYLSALNIAHQQWKLVIKAS